MKTASAELIAFLNSSTAFIMADLWTVTTFEGTVYRWTSFGYPLTVDAQTFACPPSAPIVNRGLTRSAIGLEVSTLALNLGVGDAGFAIGGVSLPLLAEQGFFDNATVLLERLFMPTVGDTSLGTVILFQGEVAQVETTSTSVALTIKSDMEKLSRQMPRNLFMPACVHVLFDAGCALTRASFLETGEVVAGLTPTALLFRTDLTEANGYFDQGAIEFTSGALNGVARPVKAYLNANGLTQLAVSLPQAPTVGDTFEIIPGCDKSMATCDTKFTNLEHYRGFPFVPPPEASR